jgi:hypothetical protein
MSVLQDFASISQGVILKLGLGSPQAQALEETASTEASCVRLDVAAIMEHT